jgi:hypothetical protein
MKPDSEATLPSSTREHNKMLDDEILRQEPLDYEAPWFQRRDWATWWSTIKARFQ